MSMKGLKHREETKGKISEALKGRVTSVEHRKHLSESLVGNTNRLGQKQSEEEVANRVSSRLKNGKRMSLEAKQKMREARLKNPNMYWVGKTREEETKERISKNLLGRYVGDTNPSWKGGKWNWAKRQVKIRDNYICQQCGLRDEEIMDVDHIKPKANYPEFITSLDNLTTLCPNCHRRKTLKEYKDKAYAKK